MLMSFAYLSEKLSDNDITLYKLKKLAGIVSSSESFKSATNKSKEKKPDKEKKVPEVKEKVIEQEVCNHKLEELSKGDVCPKCGIGKLYKYEPAITVRISGNSPLISTKHIFERLRCNSCLEYFTAKPPEEVKTDGDGKQGHDLPYRRSGHSA